MSVMLSMTQSPPLFRLLAHDLRWKLLTLLARSDYGGQELVRLLNEPQNLVSYHLGLLSDAHLVNERRSSGDGRGVYYSLDLETFRTLYFSSAELLHPAVVAAQEAASIPVLAKKVRVLFLCTHNSARSQMAEGILRHLSKGTIEVFSAGSTPTSPHPLAMQVLSTMGIECRQYRAKHMDVFQGQTFDYIITVCDRVHESCPTFPGDPEQIHWSFPDPTTVEGSEQKRSRAFEQVALQLTMRIRYLLIVIERTYGKLGEQQA